MKQRSRKGVLKVATTVQKWGNSLGVRIPQNIAKEVGIDNGSQLELSTDNGSIILRPVKNKPTLEDLCAQITEENRHQEIDFGKPAGKEVW